MKHESFEPKGSFFMLNENVQLGLGDCLELMKSLPDGSVDMILCDLPYGMTKNKWDVLIPLDSLWSEYERICRGAVVLTACQPFTSILVMSRTEWFRHAWVWEKSAATGHLNAKKMPMRSHEDILIFSKRAVQYNPQGLIPYNKVTRRGGNGTNFGLSGLKNFQEFTNYPRSVLKFSGDQKPVHPTQKPIALCEYLIKTYSNIGETVLDNCMGGGSTGVAAINAGRKFIGIERESEYFNIAKSRIKSVCN